MTRIAATVRAASAAVLALGVLFAASGWLYMLRPEAPAFGPRVRDALPLDELPGHSAIALPWYLAVWATAALLLGLLARWARVERLTGALLLALLVGGWTYAATGVSILVVRQIPAAYAFHATTGLSSTWLPAVLAGAAAALLARPHRSVRPRAPFVLAVLVAAAGILGVVAGILPVPDRPLIARLVPMQVHPLAHAFVAPLGLALIVVARGLARRKRRAWWAALAMLVPLSLLHLVHGFNMPALATALTALALLARRRDFDAAGDPDSRQSVALATGLWLALVYTYGFAALWTNRIVADQPFGLRFALTETTRALVGLNLHGSPHLGDGFGEWFPLSVLLIGATAAVFLLQRWLAPWRFRLRQEAHERELATRLVRSAGVDTLAPFVLRADKSYFFGDDERAFLAYRVVNGVAVVSGDPIGAEDAFDDLVARFIVHARSRDWRIAILGVSEVRLDLYRRHGLHALYHGDEAVIETAGFSLEGRPIRKVRQSIHRLTRAGFDCEVVPAVDVDARTRDALEEVASAWRGSQPERGFAMALDALFGVEDAVFVVGRGPDGRPRGFLHFVVSRPGSALSLSSMPRLRDTPNGFNEWLVCNAVEWAREHGYARVSLNFSPFAALLAPEAEPDLSPVQRVQRRALLSLKGHFQLDNLLLFNRKFFPSWEPRFVVYEHRRDLPRVGIAALAAEAYLPFGGKRAV